jgi:excisionase family DNA binding protein
MTKKTINMDMVREARVNLERIAREHPELTNLSREDAGRLLQGVFEVAIDKDKLTFKLEEVAEILGLSTETLRRAIKAGKLKAMKTGREYIISRPELEKYFREQGGGDLFGD